MADMIERFVGRLLRRVHAGERHLAWNHPVLAAVPDSLKLYSPAFSPGGAMPVKCAGLGVGDNVSPPLDWSFVPERTVELVLLMEDADAPLRRPVVHFIATGIPRTLSGFTEGALVRENTSVRFGYGSFKRIGYAGPRPLPGHGPHAYTFQLLAVDRQLTFDTRPDLATLLKALEGKVIARGRLDGTFERS